MKNKVRTGPRSCPLWYISIFNVFIMYIRRYTVKTISYPKPTYVLTKNTHLSRVSKRLKLSLAKALNRNHAVLRSAYMSLYRSGTVKIRKSRTVKKKKKNETLFPRPELHSAIIVGSGLEVSVTGKRSQGASCAPTLRGLFGDWEIYYHYQILLYPSIYWYPFLLNR